MSKRYKNEIENEKSYAISKFAKELLEVSDNLQRALDNVPEEFTSESE
jgi:molecular chaperone GrpE